LASLFSLLPDSGQEKSQQFDMQKSKVNDYVLNGWSIKGLFGHMWLHADFWHILGNLIFLWVFGNAVCAKIGNLIYLPIYITLGLIAAIAHLLFAGGSMIGASGAINGIVGMYLVFFAQNEITCYWIIFLWYGTEFSLSSFWMILLWLLFDVWGAMGIGGHVAYFAHLGGFAAGVTIAIVLLKTEVVKMEKHEKSLLQIWDERKNPPALESDRRFGVLEKELHDLQEAEKTQTQNEPIAMKIPEPHEPPVIKTLDEEDFIREEPITLKIVEPRKQPVEFNQEDFLNKEPIHFACPCGKRFRVPPHFAGKTSKCPKCNKSLIIPNKSDK
jgi:membrane associated rhomboid family serine protease